MLRFSECEEYLGYESNECTYYGQNGSNLCCIFLFLECTQVKLSNIEQTFNFQGIFMKNYSLLHSLFRNTSLSLNIVIQCIYCTYTVVVQDVYLPRTLSRG